jgi:hypothetical protein
VGEQGCEKLVPSRGVDSISSQKGELMHMGQIKLSIRDIEIPAAIIRMSMDAHEHRIQFFKQRFENASENISVRNF